MLDKEYQHSIVFGQSSIYLYLYNHKLLQLLGSKFCLLSSICYQIHNLYMQYHQICSKQIEYYSKYQCQCRFGR